MNAPRQTSTLAIISLVFGLLGWSFVPWIGSLVAIITGHMARREIRAANGQLDGDGLAVAGLVLGWVAMALTLVTLFIVFAFLGGLAWFAALNS